DRLRVLRPSRKAPLPGEFGRAAVEWSAEPEGRVHGGVRVSGGEDESSYGLKQGAFEGAPTRLPGGEPGVLCGGRAPGERCGPAGQDEGGERVLEEVEHGREPAARIGVRPGDPGADL